MFLTSEAPAKQILVCLAKTQVIFSMGCMAVENVQLMNECFSEYLRMVRARMK